MKLDNKPRHLSPSKEHMTKVVECNGDHELDKLLFVDSDVKSEIKCNYISLAECLSREKAFESSHRADDIGGADNVTDHSESADVLSTYVPLPEFELVKGKKDFITERDAMEIEQPKMMVCFERNEKHVIKDISIDKGMTSLDTVLDEEESAGFVTVFSNNKYAKHEADSLEFSPPNRNPFLVDSGEVALQNGCEKFDADTAGSVEKSSQHPVKEEISGIIFADKMLGSDSAEACSCGSDCSEEGAVSMPTGNIRPVEPSRSGFDLANQDSVEPESSSAVVVEPSGEPGRADECTDSSSADRHVPGPMPNNDASVSLAVHENEIKGTMGVQQHDHAMIVEPSGDNIPTSRNPFLQYGHSEESIYGPHVLSDRITYTGHVPYSGSISIRSDSSTTSTRSFAFPILQTEWNSSPVKMAKADRRHYRKYRDWTSRFFCCRF